MEEKRVYSIVDRPWGIAPQCNPASSQDGRGLPNAASGNTLLLTKAVGKGAATNPDRTQLWRHNHKESKFFGNCWAHGTI